MQNSWQDRFHAKVERREANECWPWLGCKRSTGHGQFKMPDRLVSSGAAALLAAGLAKPNDDSWALHHCDNPSCCNPDHLYWGDARQNAHDMHARGRWPVIKEEDHHQAILTVEQVKDIFSRKGTGQLGKDIAREFGVSSATIYGIWRGRTWATITGLTRARKRITPQP